MERWLGRYGDFLYSLMRIVAGFLFAEHGAQKLFGALGGTRASVPLFVVAGIIELFGGILICAGIRASFAAFIAAGEMTVAYFWAHAPHGFWPIMNKGELAALYCFVFLFIASRGSGTLSVDRALRKTKG